MEDTNPILIGLFTIIFVVVWVTGVVSWFRMVTAKDRKTYWKSIFLFVLPILLLFAFANLVGLFPEIDNSMSPPPKPPEIGELFGPMPLSQKILLFGAGITWIVGGNILFIAHNRRMGKKWWYQLNPLNPPFKDFNRKEWSILVLLLIVAMALGIAGIAQNPPLPPLTH